MAKTDAKLNISQEILTKLSSGKAELWLAVHADGSDNRINGDEIIEAAGYHASFGIISAIFQGIRKAFRNRGKTGADLAAEKEAARINQTCVVLNLTLRDYLAAARDGAPDEESLDDLIGALRETETYARAGKMQVPGAEELTEICARVAEYTVAVTGQPVPQKAADLPTADQFAFLLDLLTRQKQWFGGNS